MAAQLNTPDEGSRRKSEKLRPEILPNYCRVHFAALPGSGLLGFKSHKRIVARDYQRFSGGGSKTACTMSR
jgi:hypothetical protein